MKSLLVIGLLVLLVFLQYELWIAPNGFNKSWHLHQLVARQTQQNQNLNSENDKILADIKQLKNNDAAIESQARSKLGMIKHGEKFYRVVK